MVQGVGFDGLATGLETDEIIQQLMEIERETIVRQHEEIEEIEQEKEVWQEVNQNLVDFDNTFSSFDNEDIYQDREAISGDEDVMTVDAEPGAQPAVYRDMRVEQLAEANSFMAGEPVEETTEALDLDGEFSISLANDNGENDGINIEVNEDDSLADIRDEINQEAEELAQARIVRGRLLVEAAETGEDNAIELEHEEEDNILEELALDEEAIETDAQDAEFQIEGMTEYSSTNTDVEITDDVSVNLEGVSEENETFDIEIREDTSEFEETVDGFVDSYNELQSFLSEVTDEEEVLQGDVTARRLQSSLRSTLMGALEDIGEVNDEIFSLGEMGIEIDTAGAATGEFDGLMSIDQDEFSEAMELHMDEVQNLFLGDEEAGVDGLIDRVNEQVETYMAGGVADRGLIGNRKDNLEGEIDRIEDSIGREERRMEQREDRLREQFTQMEMAVYEAQQQQQEVAQMSQQLGATGLSDMMM